ncbi:MAG: SpoIIE family protein phosphatase [Bacteroidia bacterium]|nr:SpoIIE family protein phosphatase [Bacteroidia bacterium]
MSQVLNWTKWFALCDLDEEERIRRTILLRIATITLCFGFLWGILYFIIGVNLAATVVTAYSLLSAINLFIFYFTKQYSFFRTSQLILILFLPFCVQCSLGGFTEASSVVMASILSPLGALMFHNLKTAKRLFYAFIAVLITSGILDYLLPDNSTLITNELSMIFFVMNISVICSIVYVLLEYFVVKRDELKAVIVEKNKEILDSIKYARRIQTAIMHPKEEVYKELPDSFILYKPKDIVSGDFYYYAKTNGCYMVAAVDCTGHGVPGAFMSMIGNDLLNQIILESGETTPSEILNRLHAGIGKALHQYDADAIVMDGMDMALCKINLTTRNIEYAGARRPLNILHPNKEDALEEIKADKAGVGGEVEIERSFTNHKIQLQPGESFYIYSDGYHDQFGGPRDKKYSSRKMREFLSTLKNDSMQEQCRKLEEEIEAWKDGREQIDDILVIGVRM